ncbi:MAG: hypothetical protein AAFQ98_01915 [Bacteroidota bacterium]
MASAPLEILQLFRKHYPPAKLSPEGWILLPKPEVAVVYQPLLPLTADLAKPPLVQVPDYLEGWSTRQLWEDHWLYKRTIVQSRLLSLIGHTERVHGRQTEARRIDQPMAKEFLDHNHILGGTKAKFKYGLFRGNELLAVATFSAGRTMTEAGREGRSYELIRTCNRLGTTVVGGVSKLLKAFVREQAPDDIMTYVTRDWSEGGMYEALGFERISNTEPQWLYTDPATHQRRFLPREGSPPAGAKLCWYPGNAKFVKRLGDD